MTHAKVQFASFAAAAQAFPGVLQFGRFVGLRDHMAIVPTAALEWLDTQNVSYELLQRMDHGDVVQTLRDQLTHHVS